MLFYRVFGCIIISSTFGLTCVRRNFLFMMTGAGRGFFNIFVGGTLFMTTSETDGFFSPGTMMGIGMLIGGSIFLFLSFFKNMNDEEISRAVSI